MLRYLLIALVFTHNSLSYAQQTRSFALGFTDTACSVQPINGISPAEYAWHYIKELGDLAVVHEDGGVPWTEAYNKNFAGYDPAYKAELAFKVQKRNSLPSSHKFFLYMSHLSFERKTISAYRGSSTGLPLPEPWKTLQNEFNHPAVLRAYINHAEYLIALYRPDYFAFGTEINLLLNNVLTGNAPSDAWNKYADSAAKLYVYFKTKYPKMKIFFTTQVEGYYGFENIQNAWMKPLMPYTDMVAVSSYPYTKFSTPEQIPADYFYRIRALAPTKPFAFAETGWPAEPLFYPDPLPPGQAPAYYFHSDQDLQEHYVQRIFAETQYYNGHFINWYVSRDYDLMWDQILKGFDNANLLRMWKDIGIVDGEGNVRKSGYFWYLYKVGTQRSQ